MSQLREATASWPRLLMGIGLALALLLLAVACGGDGDEVAQPAQETPAGEMPTDEGDGEDGVGEDEDGFAELRGLAQTTEGIAAKVTYRFSSSVDGEEMEGTWTLTQRPPDTRIDMEFSGVGFEEGGTSSVIQAGGTAYICSEFAGEGTCFSVPVDQADQQTGILEPFFDTTESLGRDVAGFDIVGTSDETIAGVPAKCFEVRATELTEFTSAKVCISDDGILLLSRFTSSEGEFSIEATAVSTDVSDADFELPFPVTEFEIPTPE